MQDGDQGYRGIRDGCHGTPSSGKPNPIRFYH